MMATAPGRDNSPFDELVKHFNSIQLSTFRYNKHYETMLDIIVHEQWDERSRLVLAARECERNMANIRDNMISISAILSDECGKLLSEEENSKMDQSEEVAVFDFCSVENRRQMKEHIHVQYADGALSAALCGHTPDYIIRKRDVHEVKTCLGRTMCRNCQIIYDQLHKIRFDHEHHVMRRLLNREMMIRQ